MPFLAGNPQRHFKVPDYEAVYGPLGVPRPASMAVPPPPPPPRVLSAREQDALRELVALGADLRADFTVRELRSAFRLLALRYHPDRHPHSSDAERARLARMFARLNVLHRQLAAAVEQTGVRPS